MMRYIIFAIIIALAFIALSPAVMMAGRWLKDKYMEVIKRV